MQKAFILLFFLGGYSVASNAQIWDSIKVALKSKPSLVGYFDGRSSFVQGRPVSVFGGFVGLNYANKLDIGLSLYSSKNPVVFTDYRFKGSPKQTFIYRTIDFSFIGPRVEYLIHKTKHWEITVPINLGFGTGRITETDTVTNYFKQLSASIIPLEAGVSATYLFNRWFGFNAGMGYRLSLVNNKYFSHFTNIYYSYGFSIRYYTLYKIIRDNIRSKNKQHN